MGLNSKISMENTCRKGSSVGKGVKGPIHCTMDIEYPIYKLTFAVSQNGVQTFKTESILSSCAMYVIVTDKGSVYLFPNGLCIFSFY